MFSIDPRDARSGRVVSDKNGYYDSQNIVRGNGGKPGCFSVVLHHSFGHEGDVGLRLYSTSSTNHGITWSALKPIEPSLTKVSNDGYQLVDPFNPKRVFVFYSHGPNLTYYNNEMRKVQLPRADMQLSEGYMIKVSEDGGMTWPKKKASKIPIRRTDIDENNPWYGVNIGFFCCDKPSIACGSIVYMAFQKTKEGGGETPNSEAFFVRSKDFLLLDDINDATWETLPQGGKGLQAFKTRLLLGEEPHILQVDNLGRNKQVDSSSLSAAAAAADASAEMKKKPLLNLAEGAEPVMWSVFRTETGRLANCYSNSGGLEWGSMFWMTYSGQPSGRPFRNPRGAITPYRFEVDGSGSKSDSARQGGEEEKYGRFAFLFYNNGHTEREGYVAREVLWMVVGRSAIKKKMTQLSSSLHLLDVKEEEQEGNEMEQVIEWGQPEIVQYWESEDMASRPGWNADWAIVDGPGYCDFVEEKHAAALDSAEEDCLKKLENNLYFVASNKITVRFSKIDPRMLSLMHQQWDLCGLPTTHLMGKFISPFWGLSSSATTAATVASHVPFATANSLTCSPCMLSYRGGVLPDLRTRGGFTFLLWIKTTPTPTNMPSSSSTSDEEVGIDFFDELELGRNYFKPGCMIVDGMEEVTSARDEVLTDTTRSKGFQITTSKLTSGPYRLGGIKLHVANGFGQSFTISTDALGTYNLCNKKKEKEEIVSTDGSTNQEDDSSTHLVAFVCDGAAGVATCIVDGILCDGLPCDVSGCYDEFVQPNEGNYEGDSPKGWIHIDRDVGEIGGSNLRINWPFTSESPLSSSSSSSSDNNQSIYPCEGELLSFVQYERALLTSEVIGAWRSGPRAVV